MSKQVISSGDAPKAVGPYSQAISFKECKNLIFCSGQVPIEPTTGRIVEGGISAQAHQVFKNIRAVLSAAGSSFAHILKVTVFLKDMEDFQEMNKVYTEYITGDLPARSAIEVGRLPLDALVEIEVIAYAAE